MARRRPKKVKKRSAPKRRLEQQVERALQLGRQGKTEEAVEAYRKILRSAPKQLDATMNLGLALTRLGRRGEALERMQQAVLMHPEIAELHGDHGWALEQFGMHGEAIAAYERALELQPLHLGALTGLGRVLMNSGERERAVTVLRQATAVGPMDGAAFFTLHQALYDDRDPKLSLDAITHAVAMAPDMVHARFHLGVLLDQTDDNRGGGNMLSKLHPDPKVYAGAVDSWRYVKKHRTADTRLFATARDVLRYALDCCSLEGLVLEMGVRYGITARDIASHCGDRTLHGFDSFEGLPTEWHIQGKGAYSTHGEVPELPDNVLLHVGWFKDSLPIFAKEHEEPIRFMNVDCDLYSSTASVFDGLAHRVTSGTVIVFDEYLINDRWREDEFKAFQEAVAKHGWSYEYLAFSMYTGQAVVRISS